MGCAQVFNNQTFKYVDALRKQIQSLVDYVWNLVGDTGRLGCESRGIPQKGLQIAFVVTIYFNDVICKLA